MNESRYPTLSIAYWLYVIDPLVRVKRTMLYHVCHVPVYIAVYRGFTCDAGRC